MKIIKTQLIAFFVVFLLPTAFANAEEVNTPEGYSDHGSPGAVTVFRPMNIVHDYLNAFPENIQEGAPRLELKSYLDRADRLVIDVTQTGLLDDSVSGENRQYTFKRTDNGSFIVWGYGFRQQCARSEEIDEWTTDKCP